MPNPKRSNKEQNRNIRTKPQHENFLTRSFAPALPTAKTGSIYKNRRRGRTLNKEQKVVCKTYHVHRRNKSHKSSPSCPIEFPLPCRYWHNQMKNLGFQHISTCKVVGPDVLERSPFFHSGSTCAGLVRRQGNISILHGCALHRQSPFPTMHPMLCCHKVLAFPIWQSMPAQWQ